MTSAIFAEAAELWAEMKLEYDQWIEWQIIQAEGLLGTLVNKAGRDAGISSASLFAGSESRAMKYASDELKEHWATTLPRTRLADFEAEWLELRRS